MITDEQYTEMFKDSFKNLLFMWSQNHTNFAFSNSRVCLRQSRVSSAAEVQEDIHNIFRVHFKDGMWGTLFK